MVGRHRHLIGCYTSLRMLSSQAGPSKCKEFKGALKICTGACLIISPLINIIIKNKLMSKEDNKLFRSVLYSYLVRFKTYCAHLARKTLTLRKQRNRCISQYKLKVVRLSKGIQILRNVASWFLQLN